MPFLRCRAEDGYERRLTLSLLDFASAPGRSYFSVAQLVDVA